MILSRLNLIWTLGCLLLAGGFSDVRPASHAFLRPSSCQVLSAAGVAAFSAAHHSTDGHVPAPTPKARLALVGVRGRPNHSAPLPGGNASAWIGSASDALCTTPRASFAFPAFSAGLRFASFGLRFPRAPPA